MSRTTALVAFPLALIVAGSAITSGGAMAQAPDGGGGCAPARPVTFPYPLHPGLIVSDVNGMTLGKISSVQASPAGVVSAVQYTGGAGPQSVNPADLSYSGGDVVIYREGAAPASCAAPVRRVVFPQPLHPGLTVSDVKGMTLGKITSVQATPDGAVTGVQYADDKGATQSINPANLSYSGGGVAILE